jgi:hypothetical protein
LTAGGTTSKGTGSISCEVEFCIFYRLILRTLRTKDVITVEWTNDSHLLATVTEFPRLFLSLLGTRVVTETKFPMR